MSIFDDDGFGVEDFAFGLGFGDMVAEEERTRQRPSEEPEPLIPEDDKEPWEKDWYTRQGSTGNGTMVGGIAYSEAIDEKNQFKLAGSKNKPTK